MQSLILQKQLMRFCQLSIQLYLLCSRDAYESRVDSR